MLSRSINVIGTNVERSDNYYIPDYAKCLTPRSDQIWLMLIYTQAK